MLTDLQKQTIQAIVNIFESGKPTGDYACITLLPADPGRLTYGRSQTTLASGNLWQLLSNYCAAATSASARRLRAYLPRLAARDRALDTDAPLRTLLREAAADPVMRRAQDEFFDRAYWNPALRAAQLLGIQTALGVGVVYDSFIHGAWTRLRNATTAQAGLPSPSRPGVAATDERVWIGAYIAVRREWLATHPNPLLHRTVYRMDTFAALAEAGNWNLDLPFEAHGVLLDEQAISGEDAAQTAAPSIAGSA